MSPALRRYSPPVRNPESRRAPVFAWILVGILCLLGVAPAALAYRVESSPYATDDVIVVAKSAADLGLDNTGASDTTAGIQQLMDDVQAMGGGVAFLEPGIYRIEGRLYLRSGVYLRGVWQRPVPGDPLAASSTILAIVERPGVAVIGSGRRILGGRGLSVFSG